MNLIEKIKHARRAGVPIISIATPDQPAIIKLITKAINGGTPMVTWDLVRGTNAANKAGEKVADMTGRGEDDVTIGNPTKFLEICLAFPGAEEVPGTIAFMLNAQEFLLNDKPGDSPAVLQAISNLRDEFKMDGRTLVLLAPELKLPAAVKNDVVQLDDPLPDAKQLRELVVSLDKGVSGANPGRKVLTSELVDKAVEAVIGLSTFSAEQAIAMALRATGIDLEHLWANKIATIQQTPGLSVFRNAGSFSDVGGLNNLKKYLTKIMEGRKAPKLVVWCDEIGTSGLANRSDLSGTNNDMEGTLLQFMQDKRVYGMMLAGAQGAGKSEICKSVGGEYGRIVIRLDLEATKGGIVGQSGAQLRQALKVIEACGGEDILWIATANRTDTLSGAMKNRFTDTFFFDLPNKEERDKVWQVWIKKFGLDDKPYTDDEGFNGRNIQQTCEKAFRMNCTIEEAAEWVTPVSEVDREGIEELRTQADGRYLDASRSGTYWKASATKKPVRPVTDGVRKVNV